MNRAEQVRFLFRALCRGLNIPTPVIVDSKVQFELDGEVYIVSICKAKKKEKA